MQASPAQQWLNAEADRAGRVKVTETLTLPDEPAIFVLGDTANVQSDGKQVPGIAPAAKQQGKYAARVLRSRLDGKAAPAQFRYRHMGDLATVGQNAAIIDFGRFQMKGWLAWWGWGIAHIFFLIVGRSRLMVTISWLWSYFSGQNSARLITQKETLRR